VTSIHDVDFIRWCFGDPETVSSSGTTHDLTTRYGYAKSGVDVSARGAWLPDREAPFSMGYEVEFGLGVVRFDLAAPTTVRISRGDSIETVALPEENAYDAEVRHFLDLVGGRTERQIAPLADAVAVTRILESEAQSLATGRAVAPGLSGR
jgi:predicted dehydrogenase